MVKEVRKRVTKSLSRSHSDVGINSREPSVPKIKKSNSSAAMLGRKRRIRKKVIKGRMEIESTDLLETVQNIASLKKKRPESIEPNDQVVDQDASKNDCSQYPPTR